MATDESFFNKLLQKPAQAESGINKLEDFSNVYPVHQELAIGDFHPFAIIKYKGVFDLQRMYKVIVRWFKARRFIFYENLYRFKPPELILAWQAERRKTAFVKDIIKVNIDVRGYEEVETIVGGVRKKMVKGRLTIHLHFGLETGYADIAGTKKWNSELERRLKWFLHKYVIKRDFELIHLDSLMYETWKLQKLIKDYLRLECVGNLY